MSKKRSIKVYGQSGYKYRETPTIMLKGMWLKEAGFDQLAECIRDIIIHIKIPENELQMIHDRMEKIGVKNMSAYIRKMAIDGYYIHIDFSELLEIIKLLKIDSNNINQIAKVANSCGTVDGKTISDMKENHERVLKKVEKTFNKYLDIY